MLLPLVIAAVAATSAPPSGLPISGVSVGSKMPADASHVEAPRFRAYKVMAQSLATPSLSPAAESRKRR